MSEWKREGNFVYCLGINERGQEANRCWGSFCNDSRFGADPLEGEKTAERVQLLLNAMAGRDPSKLAALEAIISKRLIVNGHYHECLAGQRGYGQCSRICEELVSALKAFRGEE